MIDDDSTMTSSSRFVDQGEAALLDDSTALLAITFEYDDEEADSVGEFGEVELLIMNLILWIRILFGLF